MLYDEPRVSQRIPVRRYLVLNNASYLDIRYGEGFYGKDLVPTSRYGSLKNLPIEVDD
jgi:hypothetical protein